jgi:hypothetical protein
MQQRKTLTHEKRILEMNMLCQRTNSQTIIKPGNAREFA